jgi:hypothetical protein
MLQTAGQKITREAVVDASDKNVNRAFGTAQLCFSWMPKEHGATALVLGWIA